MHSHNTYHLTWVSLTSDVGYRFMAAPAKHRSAVAVMDHAEVWLRGGTPRPRSGAAAERSYLTSKERWLHGHRRAERSYSMFKVRRGSREEIPLVQGKILFRES